ncbi:MAG: sigma-70 family RNA polymerase sigma factor [Chloroflexi bacterium]|nr:sigma-70 family RNA polymerase sigma factor [Chloroflexota bacterium]
MDEDDAIRGCQNGDREAFRFVVDRYGKVLFGTAYMMTRDRPLSEDLAQEALLLAWTHIGSFEIGTNLKAWLLRILVNRTISEQRKKRVTQVELEEGAAALSAPDVAVESVIMTEERERVRRCLETLPFEQRQAVVLRYYADLTGPEIAATLGWREGTVRSRLHRALAQLRPLLEGEDVLILSEFDMA